VDNQLTRCGTCGRPEHDHNDRDPELARIFGALAGCPGFTVKRTAVIAVHRIRVLGRRHGPLCARCGERGHHARQCPW